MPTDTPHNTDPTLANVLSAVNRMARNQDALNDKISDIREDIVGLKRDVASFAPHVKDAPFLVAQNSNLIEKLAENTREIAKLETEIQSLKLESATHRGARVVIYAILGVLGTFIVGGVVWLIQLSALVQIK
jgi:predicted  nucleic acid-binding Zn-ribbon protein